jgi:hypothetical protein
MPIPPTLFASLQGAWRRRRACGLAFFAAITVFLSPASHAAETNTVHHGFLYDKHRLTLESGLEWEILGPLYLRREWETSQLLAFPPLFSYQRDSDPDVDAVEYDFLYPVLTYDRFGSEWRWQFFQLLSWAGGKTGEEEQRRRFTLFPLFFYQSADLPTNSYWGVMPFYGHLYNRLMRDEVRWVLFPAYVQTRKRDIVTDNYLLPFVHVRRGLSLRGWQVWPLIGHEVRQPFQRTNRFDELETVPGHEKWFLFWPFFHDQVTGLGTDNEHHAQAFIPLYSFERGPQRESTGILWPFSFSYTEDRARGYREWSAPWPFVTFARGEGKTMNRVWPLYSHGQTASLESETVLWPLRSYRRVHSEPLDRERLRIFYFLYSDAVEKNTSTQEYRRRTSLWPLFTHRKEQDGSERLQVLSVLEPFLPQNKSIQRNYSPVWSLWRAESNAVTRASSQSFLWNFYRQEATPEEKKTSFFFGLIKFKSKPRNHGTNTTAAATSPAP